MYRMLSQDAGWIYGTISASVLAALKQDTGKAAVDDFDLIVGTSTGGINATGLGLGKAGEDIVEFYRARFDNFSGHQSGRTHERWITAVFGAEAFARCAA